MIKELSFAVLGLLSLNSQAFHIEAKQSGLSAKDEFSVSMITVRGDCVLENGSYDCSETHNKVEGISVKYMDEFFNLVNQGGEAEKLVELNISINGEAFESCQHLQARGQNVSFTMTESGCL